MPYIYKRQHLGHDLVISRFLVRQQNQSLCLGHRFIPRLAGADHTSNNLACVCQKTSCNRPCLKMGPFPRAFRIYSVMLPVLIAHLCSTLHDPMDYSLPGSSVHGIVQTRILEWVAFSFSRGSSRPRDWTRVSSSTGMSQQGRHQGSRCIAYCHEKPIIFWFSLPIVFANTV